MGIVQETLQPAVMDLAGKESHRPNDIPALGRGLFDKQSLLSGSSNYAIACRSARWSLGELKYKGEPLTHVEWMITWYSQQLNQIIGWRGMEAVSTTYNDIHDGCEVLVQYVLEQKIDRLSESEQDLYDIILKIRQVNMAMKYALQYTGPRGLEIAMAGVRCMPNNPTSPGAARHFDMLMYGPSAGEIRKIKPDKDPGLWLAARCSHVSLDDDLQTYFDMIRIGNGKLVIKRYEDKSVLAYYPEGIRSAGVGKNKSARRPFVVAEPGKLVVNPLAPAGTAITISFVVEPDKDHFTHIIASDGVWSAGSDLPDSKVAMSYTIEALDFS